MAGKYVGFDALKAKLAKREGVTNPGALAASIGRKKYGAKRMAKMAAAGRRRNTQRHQSGSAGSY